MKATVYMMGFDCGKNGANETNCHHSMFSTAELTAEWERGKHDATLGNEPNPNPHYPDGKVLSERARERLLVLFTALANSADDTGCDGDLTVINKSALEALGEFLETEPELSGETFVGNRAASKAAADSLMKSWTASEGFDASSR